MKPHAAYAVFGGILLFHCLGHVGVLLSRSVDVTTSWGTHIASVVAALLVLIYLHRKHYVSPVDYGLSPNNSGSWTEVLVIAAWLLLAWFVVLQACLLIGDAITNRFPALHYVFPGKSILADSGFLRFLGVAYFATAYGVFEEIYYRGLTKILAQHLSSRNWKVWYVMGSSVFFGLAHWGWGTEVIVATFGLGLMTSIFFIKWGDLRPLIVAHTVYDFLVLLYTNPYDVWRT